MLNIQCSSVMKNIQDYTWGHFVLPYLNFAMKFSSLKKEISMRNGSYSIQSEICNIQKSL